MLRFAANLSFLFTEQPFMDRFESAARCGFRGVEYLFPYEWSAEVLRQKLSENHLQQVLFNLPPGDWAAGERGIACHPGREVEFEQGLTLALAYARELGCQRLHVMSGLTLANVSEAEMRKAFVQNVRGAAERCAEVGVTLLIEPINSTIDMPGYWLNSVEKALGLLAEIGHPSVRLQLDLYHAAVIGEDLPHLLRDHRDKIAHLQVADFPGRHEPGTGTVPYSGLFAQLEATGYSGWLGCEYRPQASSTEGLSWALPWLQVAG